ncbi:Niacin ECF transporter S component NiaX [uncultured Clostridium sp.]|uniref:ECF transporter S component n=1 Tax=uncultured Clostridium sp. TaxID=59620 RepID=UPI000822FA9D|nr:ECF transporter S component [uncultured Clostridium sp.]SCJ72912.1 Niacin ECF transporter S component NiaX [uncultured Clostridium sp.]
MNNRVKKMVLAGLLVSLAIIIPIQFGFLKIVLGPFSATLCSHVPMFLSMLISPVVAIVVGIGSGIGFFITGLPPYIAARALMHAPVGFIGAKVVQKEKNFKKAMLITAPLHGILEALIVIPFGFNLYEMLVVVALGTIIHHAMDAVISFVLCKAMAKAQRKDLYSAFN